MAVSLSHIPVMPADPIFGINDLCNKDTHPDKVNLVVGIYFDETGQIPVFDAVREANAELYGIPTSQNYLPIDGLPEFRQCIADKFLPDQETRDRAVVVQTVAGSGSLRVGGDFLKAWFPDSTILLSNPSWDNHKAIFEASGHKIDYYPYYNSETFDLNLEGCLNYLKTAEEGSIVLLHNSCHNPTGFDIPLSAWEEIADICEKRSLIPYIDCAYAGFAEDFEDDIKPFGVMSKKGIPFLASISFSKIMSLYNKRVGILMVVCGDKNQTAGVSSQIKRIIRTMYSNPAADASRLVTTVLTDSDLRLKWQTQLTSMRLRMKDVRKDLYNEICKAGGAERFSFVPAQNGMFSYTGLTKSQCEWLRAERHVYLTDNGRMCIAPLTSKNIAYVAKSLVEASTQP